MLGPLPLGRGGSRRNPPPGDDPHGGQITLLSEVGSQDSHVEIFPLDSAEPPLENANDRVNGDRLVVIRRRAWPQWASVDPIRPEERPEPAPIALREPLRVLVQDHVDGIFVPAGAGRGAILDPASHTRQEADTEDRETQTAQADRWCVSSTWARSSWFSLRVPGVSSANAHLTMPSGSMST